MYYKIEQTLIVINCPIHKRNNNILHNWHLYLKKYAFEMQFHSIFIFIYKVGVLLSIINWCGIMSLNPYIVTHNKDIPSTTIMMG